MGFHVWAVVLGVPFAAARPLGQAAVYFGFSCPLWKKIFRKPLPATVVELPEG